MATLPPELQADVERAGRLGSIPEVLRIVAQLTGMRFAAVARVTDQHWIACQVHGGDGLGLEPGSQLELRLTFCDSICRNRQPIFFAQASADPRFRDHPITHHFGFESYVSVPILQEDGSVFGTLCALDPEPRPMSPLLVEKIELLAQLVGAQLQTEARAEHSELQSRAARSELGKASASARLREELIGILGHDLRNPLLSMRALVDMLALDQLNQRNAVALRSMQRSLLRMEELIDFALDFARGGDFGWIALDYGNSGELQEALLQVVAETRAAYAAQMLSAHVAIDEPVHCDAVRMAQLLGSLMINAIVHGKPESLIKVSATSGGGYLDLLVHNLDGIADKQLATLKVSMLPHAGRHPQPGMDLGLHMAAEIARAHHGELQITSGSDGTRFALRIPTKAQRAEAGRELPVPA